MSQSIVSKGKTVKEAIEFGLDLLDLTKQEVDIEILQYEKKGILGFGGKFAVVKLTKNINEKAAATSEIKQKFALSSAGIIGGALTEIQLNEEEPMQDVHTMNIADLIENHQIDVSLEGKVWVKDSRIFCKASPTQFPTVTVGNGIKLYRNNQEVKERSVILSGHDQFELKVENEQKQSKWNVSVDDDRLQVLLYVEPGYKVSRRIPDIEPDQHIDIVAEETKVLANTLQYGEVLEKLEQLRVKHGFFQDEILKALQATEPATYVIAAGTKAKPGKDGWIELKVDINDSSSQKVRKDGSVDFREIKTIATVEKGQLVAIVHPPIPGQPGYTVTNEPLPPKQTFPIILKEGRGIATIENGTKIVATESGRPQFEKRGVLVKVSIMQKLTHTGNVDLASGNIRFKGDIEVLGEIEEHMAVEADGDIVIHRTVNHAVLTASGRILAYQNIIGSELSAGKSNMLVTELAHLLGIISKQIEQIIIVIHQLTGSPAFKTSDFSRGGLQPLIRILMEKKFQGFSSQVKKYVDVVRRGEEHLDDEWRNISVLLNKCFLTLTNEITSIETIMLLSQKMRELHELSNLPVEPDSFIRIPYALNSRIYCSGDIAITGPGCYNTKIHAGGALKITGALRGGEVYGRLDAEINEVGSDSGISTIIAAPSDQRIKINKAMEGTKLKLGNVIHVLNEPKYNFTASLDKNERIILR